MKKKSTTTTVKEYTCKQCGNKYNKEEVIRVYGTDLADYPYCSARCFTQSKMEQPATPVKNEGYTKGNWTVLKTMSTHETNPHQIFKVISDRHGAGDYICQTEPSAWNNCTHDEAEANAKLIASAPQLLEALKLMYELCNSGNAPGNDDLDKAYAAIQKASK